jgi:hypothetical protein
MNQDNEKQERLESLRAKRQQLSQSKEMSEKRLKRGPVIVDTINSVLGISIKEEDFRTEAQLPFNFVWGKRLEDCPGLVADYVSEQTAHQILICCSGLIGRCDAQIVLSEKLYMGYLSIKDLQIDKTVDLARKLEDSVIVFLQKYNGFVMIDYYEAKWSKEAIDFSVVMQGPALEQLMAPCFKNLIPFSQRHPNELRRPDRHARETE